MTPAPRSAPAPGTRPGGSEASPAGRAARAAAAAAPGDPYARLARGCRPRGCRAPARRVHGRRVRYVIGDEPGQVNGMRWRPERARDGR
ncbi:tryptophan biosynthesis modulator TrpM [Streptomyces sanyensis]|uniref:tryptophan biosynthesis modulator TrpM n=1 Tax=Streptomyces sanyensis TaxID=568869 RepID=UPI003D77D24B